MLRRLAAIQRWIEIAGLAGVAFSVAVWYGLVPPDPLPTTVSGLAIIAGAIAWGLPELYSWARPYFPQREAGPVAQRVAAHTGLSARGNDVSSIDLAFPFLAARRRRWARGGQVRHVFAGTWGDIPITIFDYTVPTSEASTDEYTCAQLATSLDCPQISIRPRGRTDGLRDLLRRRVVRTGDPTIDVSLHIESSDADAAGLVARALATAFTAEACLAVELRPRELLCCWPRMELALREPLLAAAARLRAALPAALPRPYRG